MVDKRRKLLAIRSNQDLFNGIIFNNIVSKYKTGSKLYLTCAASLVFSVYTFFKDLSDFIAILQTFSGISGYLKTNF